LRQTALERQPTEPSEPLQEWLSQKPYFLAPSSFKRKRDRLESVLVKPYLEIGRNHLRDVRKVGPMEELPMPTWA
jgi:hypothetical protein